MFKNPRTNLILSKALGYFLLIYFFFILGRSVWINWQLRKEIANIKSEIKELERQNSNLKNLTLYYQSESFREVEARKKLGLKKPGETAVLIGLKRYDSYQAELESQKRGFAFTPKETQGPNWRAWWQFIFE